MKRLATVVLGTFILMAAMTTVAALAGELSLNDLPTSVQKSIQSEVGNDEIVAIQQAEGEDGEVYRITWTVDRIVVHTTFSVDGEVTERAIEIPAGVVAAAKAEDDVEDREEAEEQLEREITIDFVPEPARSTILKEAGTHELAEVEIVVIAGRLLYDADWIVGQQEIAITVTPDGEVVDREEELLEEEDD